MFDELKEYFEICTKYRATEKPEVKQAIIMIVMPKLRDRTGSQRLKLQIDNFIKGNTYAIKAG
jgi:hypothetical protein